MYDAFISHIQQRKLFEPNKCYLLACSGGLDSMALAHLLHTAGIQLELAHVNFGLRDSESDRDEELVKRWGRNRHIPVHVHRAETIEWANTKRISVQMAAREIRYQFFEEVRKTHNLAGIVVAHHEDDQLETIFLNLMRGTGIEGLYGMSERRGELIRPLLPFSRAQLAAYAEEVLLAWREDRSNASLDYKRNKLRLQGLPALYQVDPDAKKNLLQSFGKLKDTGKAFLSLVELWKSQHLQEQEGLILLPYTAFSAVQGVATLLFFWLRPYGFNSSQAQELADHLKAIKIGAYFRSSQYQVSLDREALVLHSIPSPFPPLQIPFGAQFLALPEGSYRLDWLSKLDHLDRNPAHALLDAARLEYPLQVRVWEEGDRFNPLGMSSEKKISDFLIDNKVPLALKSSVKVLVSGNKIAWVIGMRIAEWAKVGPSTQKYLYIKKNQS